MSQKSKLYYPWVLAFIVPVIFSIVLSSWDKITNLSPQQVDILKWIVATCGAVVSFFIIDLGKLKLERQKAKNLNEQKLLDSYLTASDTPDPNLWLRKLHLIQKFTNNKATRDWAIEEEDFVNTKSGKIELYTETLRTASVLANKAEYKTEEWHKALKRFFQLYWADLPFIGESQKVVDHMIAFNQGLFQVQQNDTPGNWKTMEEALLNLSGTFRKEIIGLTGRMDDESTRDGKLSNPDHDTKEDNPKSESKSKSEPGEQKKN